jgi:CO/xanthine dehydrogenase Mo-binding subunit
MRVADRAQFAVVGRSVVRLDAHDKVTGRFTYGTDVRMPGMLWGKVRRSDIPHGLIRRVDVRRAQALAGVRGILTGADVGDHRGSRLVRDEPVLAKDRVRYWGEPVAIVAADTPEIAEEAVRRIEVDYEPLPAVTGIEEALAPGAPLVHPDWASYWAAPLLRRDGNIINHASVERGDLEAAFARADRVFEDRYQTQHVHQASLEGRVAVARVDQDGNVHVVSSHQFPFGLRQDIADILGIPLGKVRVTASGLGGGFGAKLYAGPELFCVLLAARTGRPVRFAYSREEELVATSPRMAATVLLRTAVTADGRLLAREGTIYYDAGAYALSSPGTAAVGTLMLPGPYAWQALRIHGYAVYTNKANCGSYRAPGGPQAAFAGECQIDRIATELGIDPLELRRRNALRDGDLGPSGQVLKSVSLRQTLDRAAATLGWDRPKAAPTRPGVRRGRGLACSWWTTTSGASSAFIKLNEDGSVVLTVGATEIGTGAVAAGVAQICAEEMGVGLEDVKIVSADTDATPYDFGAQGSRTAFQNGNAVIRAAADLKRQIFALAAERLGCPPEELQLRERRIWRRGAAEAALSLAEVARLGQARGGLLGRGSYIAPPTPYDPTTVKGHTYPAFQSPSFHTHAAEVEVDLATGEVTVVRYVVAQDVGFALNPLYATGQLTGGAAQGIGYALFEELQYRDGRVLNPTLTDYKLPTAADLPEIETILVEEPSEEGPYGAKGVGEPAVVPPAAAIVNAIYDAVGVRIGSLPVTPEKVLRALRAHGITDRG